MRILQWKTLDVLVGYPGNARPKQASEAVHNHIGADPNDLYCICYCNL